MSGNPTPGGNPGDQGSGISDTTIIIIVAVCIGCVLLFMLSVFACCALYLFRNHLKKNRAKRKDRPRETSPSDDTDDWRKLSRGDQFENVDDVDRMIWQEGGRRIHSQTANPAFGKELESVEQDNNDSMSDVAESIGETESTSDLTEIKVDEKPTATDDDITDNKSNVDAEDQQISILDMQTWGQPGSSRRISMLESYGFKPNKDQESSASIETKPVSIAAEPETHTSDEDEAPGFPYLDPNYSPPVNDAIPSAMNPLATVFQPLNDPILENTRTNPLLGGTSMNPPVYGLPLSSDKGFGRLESSRNLTQIQQDDDTEKLEFGGSTSGIGDLRNSQSVVEYYESGQGSTGSGFNLSLEGSTAGKKLLWQNKTFSGIGQTL